MNQWISEFIFTTSLDLFFFFFCSHIKHHRLRFEIERILTVVVVAVARWKMSSYGKLDRRHREHLILRELEFEMGFVCLTATDSITISLSLSLPLFYLPKLDESLWELSCRSSFFFSLQNFKPNSFTNSNVLSRICKRKWMNSNRIRKMIPITTMTTIFSSTITTTTTKTTIYGVHILIINTFFPTFFLLCLVLFFDVW